MRCYFLSSHPTRTISSPTALFLWKSTLNPQPCHRCFLPCSSIIICPCSSTSRYTGGGPSGSTSSLSKIPRCEGEDVISEVRASVVSLSAGSLFSSPRSCSLNAAAARAHPPLWLRPSQSLEEQKHVLACNVMIRAALAASYWAKRAALASLRSRRGREELLGSDGGSARISLLNGDHVKLPTAEPSGK